MSEPVPLGLSRSQAFAKRALDLVVGSIALILTAPVTAAGIIVARRDTGASGIFSQQRVGRWGALVTIHKVRTMRDIPGTTVSTANDPRITPIGRRLRAWKIDELPQLLDVVAGRMSLVGPRPDMEGWLDALTGADRVLLSVRPGITGPASLAYHDEDELLATVDDPEAYNRDVIWPHKVELNRAYVESWSLMSDVRCLIHTAVAVLPWPLSGKDAVLRVTPRSQGAD